MLLGATALPTAAADTLYRCVGKQGEVAYTSSREGYSKCAAIRSQPAAAPSRATAPAVPAGGEVEFRTATGDAVPTAAAGSERAKVSTGAVYKYTKNGVTHYTNRPPAGQRAQVLFSYIESCFACGRQSAVDFHTVRLNTGAFAAEIAAAAAEHGVDPALVRAVIHAESAFDVNALSKKGAQGLMQLIPATAERFGVADPFTPRDNILGGTRYLAWLLKRFDGDARLAAAGYNAGEGAVDRHGGVPPYAETQHYVERVGILHDRYRAALTGGGASPVTTAAGAL